MNGVPVSLQICFIAKHSQATLTFDFFRFLRGLQNFWDAFAFAHVRFVLGEEQKLLMTIGTTVFCFNKAVCSHFVGFQSH